METDDTWVLGAQQRLLWVVWGRCPVEALGDLWKDGWEVIRYKAVPARWTAGAESQARKQPSSVEQGGARSCSLQ